jgi:hypothetical protein
MRSLKYSTDLRVIKLSRQMNLPSEYVQLGRMLSGAAVLCQLESEGPFRAEITKWLPGFTSENDFAGLTR